MIVVSKRFALDDVPVFLAKTWRSAKRYCRRDHEEFATEEEQNIAQVDIETRLSAFLLISFNKKGMPLRSEVIPYE